VPGDEYHQQVLHVVQRVIVDEMMVQAVSDDASGEVRAVLADRLDDLADRLDSQGDDASAHQAVVAADIRRWQQRSGNAIPGSALQMPAGDPI
jgi:hypothetical protein